MHKSRSEGRLGGMAEHAPERQRMPSAGGAGTGTGGRAASSYRSDGEVSAGEGVGGSRRVQPMIKVCARVCGGGGGRGAGGAAGCCSQAEQPLLGVCVWGGGGGGAH